MKQFTLVFCLAAIFSGCSCNKINNSNDLKVGDKLNVHTIRESIHYKNMIFKDDLITSDIIFSNKLAKHWYNFNLISL